jgi:hypothetical protein
MPISASKTMPAGRDRHGDLGQHVADDRDRREVEAHARRVTRFEEFGHREHARAQIERHEQPAEQDQRERRDELELRSGKQARCAAARKPHEMLGADVGREDRCADDEPAGIAPRQEEVGRIAAIRSAVAEHDRVQDDEICRDDEPVRVREQVHDDPSVLD